MGVTSWLLRHTRPSLLVVTAPGGTGARVAAERYARERGWRLALNPAEANMLVVAGGGLEPYATRVWRTVPAPRVRVDVAVSAAVPGALAAALELLHDADEQRRQAQPAGAPEHAHAATSQTGHEEHAGCGGPSHDAADHPHAAHGSQPAGHSHHGDASGHGGHEHGDGQPSHGGHEQGDASGHDGHEHGGGQPSHGGHDHHMAGMASPGGVPMADRAPDRDGLMLDQLHVPLGPALPLWPPGLIVHTRLQGDVIQDATVEVLDGTHDSFWAAHPVARRLDASARLLALAGWVDAATTAQRLRDQALDGTAPQEPLRRWASRVRRSRSLRWLLAGVGRTESGDALDRLHGWLDRRDEPQWTVTGLPDLLAGTEFAAARLTVASLHG
ncbi:hypothetical protein [Actinophytocola sp.]|uniref:hypothetical protein n=1 Tax=Actinophytocola sp. TaxID=1872138 RepID=UPI002D2A4C96|nr:hypothetical protein [Actinophytocola sp.]HYQ63466.1 hypothetical protein [Actinophytocola sp.]